MNRKQLTFVLTCFLLGTFLAAGRCPAAPGDLDPTLAGAGLLRLGFGPGDDSGEALARQADGKIVLAGTSVFGDITELALLRYDTSGALDPAFGAGGMMHTGFGGVGVTVAGIAVQGDGLLVVGGTVDGRFFVARFLANGQPDPTFGSSGRVFVSPFVGCVARGLMLQPADGKILLAGYSTATLEMAVIRVNANGSLDDTFGTQGVFASTLGGRPEANALILQPGGKILVAGSRSTTQDTVHRTFLLARLNSNGSLDTSFDGDGWLITSIGITATAWSLALQENPISGITRIVLAGEAMGVASAYADIALARYDLNGALDTTFDTDGVVVTSTVPGNERARGVAIQLLGSSPSRILVGGESQLSPTTTSVKITVVRYLLTGALDTTFDGDGVNSTDRGTAAALLVGGGRVTTAGTVFGATEDTDFGLVTFTTGSGALDPSWDGDGRRSDNLGLARASAQAVCLQADGRIVVAGQARRGIHDYPQMALARLLPDGSRDVSFDGDGRLLVQGLSAEDAAAAVLVQPDGRIVVGGSLWSGSVHNVVLVRRNPDGSPDLSFGIGGMVNPYLGAESAITGLALQPDGKLIAVGYSGTLDNPALTVVRFLPNGAFDADFGFFRNGVQAFRFGDGPARAWGVTLQADGRILVAGSCLAAGSNVTPADGVLVRLNPNGSLDSSFDGFGARLSPHTQSDDRLRAVIVQSGGRILATGQQNPGYGAYTTELVTLAVQSDGTAAASWGDGGTAVAPLFPANSMVGTALAAQPNGRVVMAGYATTGNAEDIALFRFTAEGVLETGYGVAGRAMVDFTGAGIDRANGLALDTEGRAVLACDAGGLFGIARVIGDGAQTGVADMGTTTAAALRLGAPWPNPMRSRTSMTFDLPGRGTVEMTVFDATGRLVARRATEEPLEAGPHTLSWDGATAEGTPAASGIYFLRVRSDDGAEVRRVSLVR